ncbi:MAG: type II secretion system F family protein [Flavobacteriaceae bacterium]|nr:type II secretion system F family protein [Flavobacteriaceae bacterium]
MSISIGKGKTVKPLPKTVAKPKGEFLSRELFASKKINDKKKAALYKDLSILLKSGIDFKTSLTIIKDQQQNKHLKQLMDGVLNDVIKGKAFFEAMDATGRFSSYEIFSIRIGEETRKLDTILEELQLFFERKMKLRKQVISILTYPAFIMVLTLATLYFMLTYVVPLFESVFNQFNRELPVLTKYVITLSENFNMIFLLFIGSVVLLLLAYKQFKDRPGFKRTSSRIVLRIPFFGKLIKDIYITRFCQSMALLLVSKTSLLESLGMVRNIIGFYPIAKALEKTEKDITKGIGLGDSLSKSSIFDSNLISMVRIAEQINELDSMFVRLAKQYDDEVEHKTKVMGTIIEPLLILFIGGIVGVIMISMYAPMFDLSEVIGGN